MSLRISPVVTESQTPITHAGRQDELIAREPWKSPNTSQYEINKALHLGEEIVVTYTNSNSSFNQVLGGVAGLGGINQVVDLPYFTRIRENDAFLIVLPSGESYRIRTEHTLNTDMHYGHMTPYEIALKNQLDINKVSLAVYWMQKLRLYEPVPSGSSGILIESGNFFNNNLEIVYKSDRRYARKYKFEGRL